ncbi:hypothetical protein KY331_01705 [Candidatus Woesearchaeota archaeon]|nr:hypothetical protein [Candidatus Woesearchaeota archaeon]
MPYEAKDLGDYLKRMQHIYRQIRRRNLDVFVCRGGDDNPIVVLPDAERPQGEDGSVELSERDYDYLTERGMLSEMVIASIREGLMSVYRFTQPEFDENIDISKLEAVLKGKKAFASGELVG